MDPQHPGAFRRAAFRVLIGGFERCRKRLHREGHGGRTEGRDAAPGQLLPHRKKPGELPVRKILPHASVNMKIHQPREYGQSLKILAAFQTALRSDLRKPAVPHAQAPTDKALLAEKKTGIRKNHRRTP